MNVLALVNYSTRIAMIALAKNYKSCTCANIINVIT